MSPEMEALRSHRGVIASVIAAAIGFTLFCLVGIAVLLGWIGPGVRPIAGPTPPVAARAKPNDLALSPGETVVATADNPPPAKPAEAPPPAKPAEPPPAKAAAPIPKPAEPKHASRPKHVTAARKPAEAAPRKEIPPAGEAHADAPAAAPAMHPTDPGDRWPQPACGNCGIVRSITIYPDAQRWEVRVTFDDGGHRNIRYTARPRWRVGDRVRYEGGRLQRE